MIRTGVALVVLGLLGGNAMAAENISAGELMTRCLTGAAKRGDASLDPANEAICNIVMSSYRDGIIEGTFRGVSDVYMRDDSVAGGINGIADLQRRVGPSLVRARCGIQPKGDESVARLRESFISYLLAHPEESGKPYTAALASTIEKYFCQR